MIHVRAHSLQRKGDDRKHLRSYQESDETCEQAVWDQVLPKERHVPACDGACNEQNTQESEV